MEAAPEYAVPLSTALAPLLKAQDHPMQLYYLRRFKDATPPLLQDNLDDVTDRRQALTHLAAEGDWLALTNVCVYQPQVVEGLTQTEIRRALADAIMCGQRIMQNQLDHVNYDQIPRESDEGDVATLKRLYGNALSGLQQRFAELEQAHVQLLQTVHPDQGPEKSN